MLYVSSRYPSFRSPQPTTMLRLARTSCMLAFGHHVGGVSWMRPLAPRDPGRMRRYSHCGKRGGPRSSRCKRVLGIRRAVTRRFRVVEGKGTQVRPPRFVRRHHVCTRSSISYYSACPHPVLSKYSNCLKSLVSGERACLDRSRLAGTLLLCYRVFTSAPHS
jgi:hypothetical protein